MILQCPSCSARYLVQIGLFAQGGRKVRCARCRHEWHATLPTTIDVFKAPEFEPVIIPPPSPPTASAYSTSPPGPMPQAKAGEGPRINLPAVVRRWRFNFDFKRKFDELKSKIDFKRLDFKPYFKWLNADLIHRAAPYVLGGLLAMALIAWPFIQRQTIVRILPQLGGFYELLGFSIDRNNMGLTFDQVKSELRYDGGTMHLYVDGVIHNATSEAQLIPDIKARALGPDKSIVQSWWVDPPVAAIAAESDIPFHTEVITPMKRTIENVYLEFASQEEKTRHDEGGKDHSGENKSDAAQ